ncbi:hypothetical protein BOTCAL_0106g00040 [Botryotinia calthae]|uniref:Uncharacterized protein n=1 Tax=Botryotinia calthae TaxID=38488 RepID=A0A4Y8D7U8_9HELO|nr:hypothetical protein BOTCAL_0106g00040 [Botryotinia calthae]
MLGKYLHDMEAETANRKNPMFPKARDIFGREESQVWVLKTPPEVDGRAGLSCSIPPIEGLELVWLLRPGMP